MSTKNIREPRFIFSTDYMHLAEAGNVSKYITIPAMSISANDSTANGYIDVDFPVPNGAISRSIIEYKGSTASDPSYVLSNGSFRVEEMYDDVFYWDIFWHRLNDQKIRVEYYVVRLATGWDINVPALTFQLIQQYLKAPN